MICTNCGATIPDTTKFCNKCGSPATATPTPSARAAASQGAVCANCGSALAPNAKFCARCGSVVAQGEAPAAASAPAPAGNACPNCGATLLTNAKFCAKCGTTVATAKAPTPEEQPAEVSAPPARPSAKAAGLDVSAVGPSAVGPAPPPQPPTFSQTTATGTASEVPAIIIRVDWFAEAARVLQRVFMFDLSVYSELRADTGATALSLVIAAISMFAFGLGGYLWFAIEIMRSWEAFWKSVLVGSLLGLGFWVIWVFVAIGVLTFAFRQTLRLDEVLRVAGAASAPLALGFFMFIPGTSFGVALIAVVLWVITSVFALQAALEITPQQAIVANLAGFAVWTLVLPLIVTSDNPLGPGILWFDWSKDSAVDLVNQLRVFGG